MVRLDTTPPPYSGPYTSEPHHSPGLIPASVEKLGEETTIPLLYFSTDKALYYPETREGDFNDYAAKNPQVLRDTSPGPLHRLQWIDHLRFWDLSQRQDPEGVAQFNVSTRE